MADTMNAPKGPFEFRRDAIGRYLSTDGRFVLSRRQYGHSGRVFTWVVLDRGSLVAEERTLNDAKRVARERA